MAILKKMLLRANSFAKFLNLKTTFFCLSFLILFAASAQSIVAEHGRLRVSGNKVVNKLNEPISLAGNSLFWSNYSEGAKFYNAQTVNHLANDWKTDIVRASMGVENTGGYISDPVGETNKVKAVVDAAINAGVYVIIDWHSHNAEQYQSQAITFFTEMSQLYGNNDHVIYEIYNEPIAQSWPTIKSYAEAVIDVIRVNDPDNLIVVGTRTWSQEVEEASNNPINKTNIAYTLHFYAGTHKQSLRNKAINAMNNGIALFATEWGAVNADGNGAADIAETNLWMNFLKDNNISHTNWSVSDKPEGASVVAGNAGVSGLVDNNLSATGTFIKDIIKTWNANGGNGNNTGGDPDNGNDGGTTTQTPYAVVNIPGIIQAEDYDNGGQGVSFNDVDTTNNGGQYRNDAVDIQSTTDSGGGNNVGWIANGEWLEYTIASIAPGDYNISFRVASPSSTAKSIKITVGNIDLGNVVIPNTGGWQIWQDVTLNNITISGGSDLVLKLEAIGGNFNFNWVNFETVVITDPIDPIDPALGAICEAPAPISLPFVNEGLGTFCWVTSGTIEFINSWGLEILEINGVNYTNNYFTDLPPRVDGNYYISYTSNNTWGHFEANGTGGTAAKTVINDLNNEVSIVSMYPNPSKGTLAIKLLNKPLQTGSVTLYNNLGNLVKVFKLENKQQVIDISSLPSGVYFARIFNNGETSNKTIVKQ